MERPLSGEPPEASFSSIVLFFATMASQYLGIIKNPITDKVEPNLELAKHTIDSLDVLKEKTKGNLTKEENDLLESMLSNLKLTYVKEQSEAPRNTPDRDTDKRP